jgi:hypothetical protein
MSEPAPSPSDEVDFLSALRLRGLALIALCGFLGATGGLGVGRVLLRRHEARVVLRIATLGLMGPVVPLSEVKARAEARSQIIAVLTAHHAANPATEVDAYKVTAEPDVTRDGTVVTLTADGPDPELTLALAKDISEALTNVTHSAFAAAIKEHEDELARAARTTDAFSQAASARPAGQELQAQTEVALEFERWAGEVASIRQRAQREVLTSRDTEVIDPPFLKDNNTRVILVAALGAFAGMLLALAFAVRPASRAA